MGIDVGGAVGTDSKGNWRIWGLIDQSVHYSTYIVKEAHDGPEMPGMFQAVIQGIGEIAVFKTYVLLGSLRQDALVTKQLGVFEYGPIRSKLAGPIETFQKRVRRKVGNDLYEQRDHWDVSLERMWISAFCRILIGIQKYRHGGAVLISDGEAGLNAKYSLAYRRFADAIFRMAVLQIQHTSYSDDVHGTYLDKHVDEIPTELYLDERVSGNELEDTPRDYRLRPLLGLACARRRTHLARLKP